MKYWASRIVLVLVTFALFQAEAATPQPLPEIIPHRGGRAEFPENTLQSLKNCVSLGATTLEIDIQVTRDGMAVVYHPGDLSANTDGKGKVSEFSYDDLKKLDAAYKFEKNGTFPERGKGHKIPLFEEVLEAFPSTKIIVDLTSLPANTLVEAIAKVAEKHNAWGRLVFYSTDDSHLAYLKAHYPQAISFESRRNTVEELLNATGSTQLTKTEKPIWLGFELERQGGIRGEISPGRGQIPY